METIISFTLWQKSFCVYELCFAVIDHPGTTFIFFLSYISPSNIVLNGKYDLSKALYATIQIVKSEKMESKGINIVSRRSVVDSKFLREETGA